MTVRTTGQHWSTQSIKDRIRRRFFLWINGADVNAKAHGGATALMFAAGYDNTQIVNALLARGADPYAKASSGVTVLTNAVAGGWI